MRFTYRNNVWKSNATNSIIPSNSRPIVTKNGSDSNSIAHVYGKPNPLKHWRKQLKPTFPTPSSKQVSIDHAEKGNYIGVTPLDCDKNYKVVKNNVSPDLSTCDGSCYIEPFYDASIPISQQVEIETTSMLMVRK